jgi:hypothetical protein
VAEGARLEQCVYGNDVNPRLTAIFKEELVRKYGLFSHIDLPDAVQAPYPAYE